MGDAGRVVVVGGNASMGAGLISRAIAEGFAVTATTRHRLPSVADSLVQWQYLDLTREDSIKKLSLKGATHAILLAGVTSIAQCEREPELSRAVNVTGLGEIAQRLFREGAVVTALSTSQVFSRHVDRPMPTDERAPTCQYGLQKVLLEDLILDNESGRIVRLTKVLPPKFPLFVDWVARLRKGDPVEAFSNVSIAPVLMDSAQGQIWQHTTTDSHNRICHISSTGNWSYSELMTKVARLYGLPGEVFPTRVDEDPLNGVITGPFARLGLIEIYNRPSAEFGALATAIVQ
jgi:dTDP-4-dehydrorhamnose reductase